MIFIESMMGPKGPHSILQLMKIYAIECLVKSL